MKRVEDIFSFNVGKIIEKIADGFPSGLAVEFNGKAYPIAVGHAANNARQALGDENVSFAYDDKAGFVTCVLSQREF